MDQLSAEVGRWSVGRSYSYCERLAMRSAGNFYHAFRILPAPQRRAMCALYSFLRIADDLGDGPGDADEKRELLARWRGDLHAALAGDFRHPIHPALHHAIREHGIPVCHLEDVLDGVEMDLGEVAYPTFDDLYGYCYKVASAVGLSCIPIWGYPSKDSERTTDEGQRTKDETRGEIEAGIAAAEAAGIALQLTNILRDVGEDLQRGRVYLPGEDLARFGCSVESLRRGVRDERFQALMRFEAERAYGYYEEALPLAELLPPPGRAVYLVILRTYRGLLDAIVAGGFDVFSRRVGVGKWFKTWQAVRALPVRWGWV